jgi:hypothetical protein
MTQARRIFLLVAFGVALSVAQAGSARADQVHYIGVHPIVGGGFCYIEGPHVHVFAPAKSKAQIKALYRVHDGSYYFVGDPVAFGYKGPKKNYYGHHPVAVDVVVGEPMPQHDTEWCYIDGPHYHYFVPPADVKFVVDGGAYWYAGTYPPEYEHDRAAIVEVTPAVYAPIVYERPVITVVPPAVYLGPVVEVHGHGHGHGVVGVGVGVGVSAGVEVHVPAPTIEVGVGVAVPGVIIVDEHKHHHDNGWHKGHWKHHH